METNLSNESFEVSTLLDVSEQLENCQIRNPERRIKNDRIGKNKYFELE